MEQAYAMALWKMVEGGMDHRKAVTALRELLKNQGRERLLPRIARAFERIAHRDAKKNDLVLTVADAKDIHTAEKVAKEVLKQLNLSSEGGSAFGGKTHVDDTLIGGWRLEGRGVLVDQSYKKHLLDIYNRSIA
jgi:F0F1-type ATP synthase delta subunit